MNVRNQYMLFALVMVCLGGSVIAMQGPKTELHRLAADRFKYGLSHLNEVLWDLQLKGKLQPALEAKDEDGNTPLHEAAYYDNFKRDELLMIYGSDVNAINYKGETPLDKAHYAGNKDLEDLIRYWGGKYAIYKNLNKDLSQKDLDKALWEMVTADPKTVKMLLEKGANPNVMHPFIDYRDIEIKMTPLHYIAMTGDYKTPHDTMEYLVAYGANINAIDSAGWTPHGRSSQGADSQTGDHIGSFFSKRDAKFIVKYD